MENIVLYCKSYKGDVERVKKLKDSIKKYNKDDIPFYVSCPKEDKQLFKDILGTENYTLVDDESIYEVKSKGVDGWRSQQLVKSFFHRLKVTKNYFCLDSDAYFIKDFYISDFIAEGDTPYTLIHENKELQQYRKLFHNSSFQTCGYAKAVRSYRDVFGSSYKKIYDYGPNPYIWSCKVWEHFEKNYLNANNINYEDFQVIMERQYGIQMREACTYGEYLLATRVIDIIPTCPFFKVYHWKEMVEYETKTHISIYDDSGFSKTRCLADREITEEVYLGIIEQSNMEK